MSYAMVSETILRLHVGEAAPPGLEIRRVIGTYQQMTGAGANFETLNVVAAAPAPAEKETHDA